MTTLVVGATGMTGRALAEQLLGRDHNVRVMVRASHKLPAEVLENPNMTVIEASILDLTDEELREHVKGCDAVVSCLGHVMDFKGIFGDPKRLCTDATFVRSDQREQLTRTDQVHFDEHRRSPEPRP